MAVACADVTHLTNGYLPPKQSQQIDPRSSVYTAPSRLDSSNVVSTKVKPLATQRNDIYQIPTGPANNLLESKISKPSQDYLPPIKKEFSASIATSQRYTDINFGISKKVQEEPKPAHILTNEGYVYRSVRRL